jgi:glycosyltransferase involved in cell wall biosynthesis
MKLLVLPFERSNPYQGLLYGAMRPHGVEITYLAQLTPSKTLNNLLLPAEMAVRRLRGARVVHLHWVWQFGVDLSYRSQMVRRATEVWFAVWLWTLRLLGMRLVWTAHNVLPVTPVFTNELRARKRLVAYCDLVIAHSTGTLEELARLGMVPRRSVVIPHGPFTSPVDPASLRTPGDGQGPRRLLFFGKMRPYKGIDTLLAAFSAVPPDVDVRLTVAGECTDDELTAELTEFAEKSGGRVTLRLERIPDAQLAEVFEQADAMVLPYRQITTTGSGILGLGHGRPLVVPDVPGLSDLPDDALLRYDGTVEGLTDAFASIARADAAELAKMSDAAFAYCAAIGWDEIADKTFKVMTEIRRGGS